MADRRAQPLRGRSILGETLGQRADQLAISVEAQHLEARQILDVIVTAGAYTTIAWLMKSVGIDLDDDLLADGAG